MAYTKSPSQDTYSTEEIDITKEIITRLGGLDKDEDYLNVFMEPINKKSLQDKRQNVTKRAGSADLISSQGAFIRGSAYWADQQKLFYCIGATVYVYNFLTTVNTPLTVFVSTTGIVGFAEFIYNDGTSVMVVSDGTLLLQISTSNSITNCTDTDLPVHDPNIIFIDGYILVCKIGTGDIYNSDNNNPLSWTPGNFINAEIEADVLIRLGKVNNYIVAFGTETIEYFWDAAIATGSPFQRNDTPVKRISLLSGYTQEQNFTFFIGRDLNSDIQVYKMTSFKCDPISTPTISRYLNTLGGDYKAWTGTVIAYMGHTFYVINAGTRTYCYDIQNDLWTRLSYKTDVNFNLTRAHCITTATAFTSVFTLGDGTSSWYKFDETLFQDSGTNFPAVLITDSNDFGTLNRKNMHRLSFYADRPPVNSNILVQWSDDDYQTFNTGRSTSLNQDLVCLRQLGSFRQRCFKLTHTDNAPFRIQGLVADINKGNS